MVRRVSLSDDWHIWRLRTPIMNALPIEVFRAHLLVHAGSSREAKGVQSLRAVTLSGETGAGAITIGKFLTECMEKNKVGSGKEQVRPYPLSMRHPRPVGASPGDQYAPHCFSRSSPNNWRSGDPFNCPAGMQNGFGGHAQGWHGLLSMMTSLGLSTT